MKRLLTAVCFSLMCLTPVLAQDSETDQIEYLQSEETEEPVFEKRNFFKTKAGDQIIRISLDGTIPLNFPSITTLFTEDKKLAGGGSGYIGYHYFITDQLAVGGNLGFGCSTTHLSLQLLPISQVTKDLNFHFQWESDWHGKHTMVIPISLVWL